MLLRIKIELGSLIQRRVKAKMFSQYPARLRIQGVYRTAGRSRRNNLRTSAGRLLPFHIADNIGLLRRFVELVLCSPWTERSRLHERGKSLELVSLGSDIMEGDQPNGSQCRV